MSTPTRPQRPSATAVELDLTDEERAPRPRVERRSARARGLLGVVVALLGVAWALSSLRQPQPDARTTGRTAPAEVAQAGPAAVAPGDPGPGRTALPGAAVAPRVDGPAGGGRAGEPAEQELPGPPAVQSPEGFLVAPGGSERVGAGPLRTFTLEVEPETGIDLAEFTVVAEETLLDPRGWTADGSVALQRVADPAQASVRVVLARPATVDHRCSAAGLDTNGVYSCFDGTRAMLNLDRWRQGAAGFSGSLDGYRRYLVNHEVGHGLGHGHRGCPTAGAAAPVMMQQSKTTGACTPNSWPFPDGTG